MISARKKIKYTLLLAANALKKYILSTSLTRVINSKQKDMITEQMNFIKGLNLCVLLFLIKKSIIPKKQGNHFMTGDELASHIVECLKFCKGSIVGKLPKGQNKKVYYMKDEIRLMILCDALKDYYTEKMNFLTEVARTPNNFEKSH
jgi:hypothetical protein